MYTSINTLNVLASNRYIYKSGQCHPHLTDIFYFWHSATLALRMTKCNQLTALPFKGSNFGVLKFGLSWVIEKAVPVLAWLMSWVILCTWLIDDSPRNDHMAAEEVSRYKKTRSKKATPALAAIPASDDTMSVTGHGIHWQSNCWMRFAFYFRLRWLNNHLAPADQSVTEHQMTGCIPGTGWLIHLAPGNWLISCHQVIDWSAGTRWLIDHQAIDHLAPGDWLITWHQVDDWSDWSDLVPGDWLTSWRQVIDWWSPGNWSPGTRWLTDHLAADDWLITWCQVIDWHLNADIFDIFAVMHNNSIFNILMRNVIFSASDYVSFCRHYDSGYPTLTAGFLDSFATVKTETGQV